MNIKQAFESLDYLFKANLTGFFWGRAGIGKTSIIKQYCKDKGYKFFAFYLGTQSDVGDILGLAEFVTNKDGSKSTVFAIPKWLKETIDYCNENPDSGAVIFLDEFNRARRDILSGMFSLALDKTFHTLKLPTNCHIVAAGNPPTPEYQVTDIDETALMARFVHIKLEPTFQEWVEYAEDNKMESSLVGFLKDQPALLEQSSTDFQLPVKVDRRAYERLDRLYKINTPAHLMENLMVGIIGLERTVAYQTYLKKADKPLQAEEVLNGKGLKKVTKWSDDNNTQGSLLNLTCENLNKFLAAKTDNLTAVEKKNLYEFLTVVPKDISYPMIKALVISDNATFKDFFTDKKYEADLVSLAKVARGIVDKAEPKDEKVA